MKIKAKRQEKKMFLTWWPLQHREHLSSGTGKGDAGFAATLLAKHWCVTEKLTGPLLPSDRSLRLLLGLLLPRSLCLNGDRWEGEDTIKTQGRSYSFNCTGTEKTGLCICSLTSEPAPPLPPASTTASIFSSSTMATLSSVFLRFSCSFLMSSRKRFSLVGFSGTVDVTELATLVVEVGSADVGDVGEPPAHSCSTVMFFRLSRIFKASFNSLKVREAPSLLGFSAPLTAPPGVVPTQIRGHLMYQHMMFSVKQNH